VNKPFPFPPHKNKFSLGQGAIIVLLLFILFGNVFYMGYRSYEVFTLNDPSQEKGLEKLALIQNTLDKNFLYSDKVPYEQMFDNDGLETHIRYIQKRI
jgi:hypothetical protein